MSDVSAAQANPSVAIADFFLSCFLIVPNRFDGNFR